MEAGVKQGIEKRNQDIVKNALKVGTDMATIAKITGLCALQITAMQEAE